VAKAPHAAAITNAIARLPPTITVGRSSINQWYIHSLLRIKKQCPIIDLTAAMDAPEMTVLQVTRRDGSSTTLESTAGLSLMETLRDAGFSDVAALCGGGLSCGTCHVYLDATSFTALPAPGEDEAALLDASDHRREVSRLSCQVMISDELGAVQVTIAPED
jgi:ferredoxin, 2Fe-2S